MRPIRFLPFLILGGAAACGGAQVTETGFSANGGAGGQGGSGTGGATTTSFSSSSTSASSSSGSSSTSSSSSSSGATSSSSSSSGSSSSSTGGPVCDFDAPNNCNSALQLTDLDGDVGADVRTVTGTTSKWFKVLVIDNQPSGFNDNVSYTATLESPPGMDFDLYAYTGDSTGPNCFGNPAHAVGNPESLSDLWSDDLIPKDDKWITFEVRYISGEICDAKWTLTVQGHTAP